MASHVSHIQTHVSDGLQAATVCLLPDILEGRETQADKELVQKERHIVSRQKEAVPFSPPPSPTPLPSKASSSGSPPPAQLSLQIFTAMSSFLFLSHPNTTRLI